jgi:hypothetical protein
MYIDWKVTQKTYIKYLVKMFDEYSQYIDPTIEFIPDEEII